MPSPLKLLLSFVLIFTLVISPVSVTLAQEGEGDGDGDGEGDGPGLSGEGEGNGEGGGESAPDSDGDGMSDAAETSAAEAAAESVATNAAAMGVDVTVSPVDAANDPNSVADPANPNSVGVTVNGVTMSAEAANEAISSIAEAQNNGLDQSNDPDKPGVDVNSTLEAHAQGERGVVQGSMSGVLGPPGEVADAEAVHSGRANAVSPLSNQDFNSRFNAAPAADVTEALNTIAAHPSLLSAAPLANVTPTLSINTESVNISATPIGQQSVTQTFSTENAPQTNTMGLDSVSLGANTQTAPDFPTLAGFDDPFGESWDPDEEDGVTPLDDSAFNVRAGDLQSLVNERASLTTITAIEQEAIEAHLAGTFFSTSPLSLAASLASNRASLEAINAQIEAMTNPNHINSAIYSATQEKASATQELAQAVAIAEANNDIDTAYQTLDELDQTTSAYSRSIDTFTEKNATALANVNDLAAQNFERARSQFFSDTYVTNPSNTLAEDKVVAANQNILTDWLGVPEEVAGWIALPTSYITSTPAIIGAQISDSFTNLGKTFTSGLANAGLISDDWSNSIENATSKLGSAMNDMMPTAVPMGYVYDAVNFNHAANNVGPEHADYQTYSELASNSLTNAGIALAVEVGATVVGGVVTKGFGSVMARSGIEGGIAGRTSSLANPSINISDFSTTGGLSRQGAGNYANFDPASLTGRGSVPQGSISVTPTSVSGRATGSLGGRPDTTVSYNPTTNTATISQSRYGGVGAVEGRISYDTAPTRSTQVGIQTADTVAARAPAQAANTAAPASNAANIPVTNTSGVVGRSNAQPTAPTTRSTLGRQAINTAVAVSHALNVAAISPPGITRGLTEFAEQAIMRSADDILGPNVSIVTPNANRAAVTPMSWANVGDEAIAVRSISVVDGAGRVSAPVSLNQISPTAVVQTVNVVAPTPATDLARGLTDLGEVPANLQAEAQARGYDLNSPQEVVALGIAHEMAGPTRANIVNAYQANPDFSTLSDGDVGEVSGFLNALAGESARTGRTVAEQVAVPDYLTSVTGNERAFDTFRNPQVREALTALATKLTDGSMANERGLNVVTPVSEANHWLTLDLFNKIISGQETVHGQWAKSLINPTRVGDYAQSVIGFVPSEINPTEEGLRAVVQRSPMLTEPTLLNNQPGRLEIVDVNPNTVAATQPDIVSPTNQTPAATPASLVNDLADTARGFLSYIADPSTLTRTVAVERIAQPTPATPPTSVETQLTVDPNDPSQAQFGLHTSVEGVDERAVNIMRVAAEEFPLRVRLFSGKAGRDTGGHSRGFATDVAIYDVDGRPIGAYQTPQTANVYALFALKAREVQMRMYPELNNRFVWGGAWRGMARGGGGTRYGAADWMDFRIGHSGQNSMNAFKWPDPEQPGSGGWQPGYEHYTEGDFLGIGSRNLTEADYEKLAGFRLTDEQWQQQYQIAKTGGPKGPFYSGLLGRKHLAAKVSAPQVATTPPEASDVVTTVSPQNPNIGSMTDAPNAGVQTDADDVAALPGGQGPSTFPDQQNQGLPPTSPLSVGSGGATQPQSTIGRVSALTLATIAAFVGSARELLGLPTETEVEDGLVEDPTLPNDDTSGDDTNDTTDGQDDGGAGDDKIRGYLNSALGGDSTQDTATSSAPELIDVLVQVDADTGAVHFDIAGMQINGEYHDHSYPHDPDEPLETTDLAGDESPSIVLSEDNRNVIYSDGTYAPVILNGVWYEAEGDPRYVYTVEVYQNGQLVDAPHNSSVLPDSNEFTNLLGKLFSNTATFAESDIEAVTRALIDPDSGVPADEYYLYRIYLKDGTTRAATVPHYTSYRYLTERFGEIGYVGNVLTLIAGSVEVPADTPTTSKVVETLKELGIRVIDLFRGDEAEAPTSTDLSQLISSGAEPISMEDITAVTVLFGIEAKCPAPFGIEVPYLYEVVIAPGAIEGTESTQAVRAVRCGGGEKWDYVNQIANHLETFQGVGTLDRQKLYDLIRFGDFRDVDFEKIIAASSSEDTEVPTTSTSTEALPDLDTDSETEVFKPNLTNTITFEVKAVGTSGNTITDWTDAEGISISSGVQLYFRWNGSDYQQCLPFLNDNGNYSLVVQNRAMITGNTESEGYNVPERNAIYRVECGGQRNNEFGVDFREIEVIVD